MYHADGFGPSTGRFAELCETSENRTFMNRRPVPPVVGIFSMIAAFFCFVFGATSVNDNLVIPGTLLLIAGTVLVALTVIWVFRRE